MLSKKIITCWLRVQHLYQKRDLEINKYRNALIVWNYSKLLLRRVENNKLNNSSSGHIAWITNLQWRSIYLNCSKFNKNNPLMVTWIFPLQKGSLWSSIYVSMGQTKKKCSMQKRVVKFLIDFISLKKMTVFNSMAIIYILKKLALRW